MTLSRDSITDAKLRAAQAALAFVRSGMTVGLGSGSTATLFIEALGKAISDGTRHNLIGIPTSRESERLARSVNITIGDFAIQPRCDITIDGADEADPNLDLIKGLGGALLREKLVAQNSTQLIIIVDSAKQVAQLGTKGPLPVEVTPFGLPAHERFLRSLDASPTLRLSNDGTGAYVTDNGNNIFDCRFAGGIDDPYAIAQELQARAGIVEHGLFLAMARTILIATPNGEIERHDRPATRH